MEKRELLRDLEAALRAYRSHLEGARQGLVPATGRDPGSALPPVVDRQTVAWLLEALGPGAPPGAREEAEELDREFESLAASRPDYWERLRREAETLLETLLTRGVAVALLPSGAEFLNAVAERTYLQVLVETLEARGADVAAIRRTLEAEEPAFRSFVARHREAGFEMARVPYAPPRYWWLRTAGTAGREGTRRR